MVYSLTAVSARATSARQINAPVRKVEFICNDLRWTSNATPVRHPKK